MSNFSYYPGQLSQWLFRRNRAMRTVIIVCLTVVLLLNSSHPPLIGAEATAPLTQRTICSALRSDFSDSIKPSVSSPDNYYEVINSLKEDLGHEKEKIDLFMYDAQGDSDSSPFDVDTFSVSRDDKQSSECTWLGGPGFYCYILRADLRLTSGAAKREWGMGSIFPNPGDLFNIIYRGGKWELDDGDNTVIFVSTVSDLVNLRISTGENYAIDYFGDYKEIDISYKSSLSLTAVIRGVSYAFNNVRVRDNMVYEIYQNTNDALSLREVSCREDGNWSPVQ